MRQLLYTFMLAVLAIAAAQAQQNPSRNVDKNKQPTGQPTGNPGDPKNATKGPAQQTPGQRDQEQDENANGEDLLGADNEGAANDERASDRSNYRSNRVRGNPNNREIDDGSNRRSTTGDSGESSTSDDATGTPDGADRSDNPGILIDRSSSGSGSPAVLSEDDGGQRDGTNNVQRAKPNMAGSPVGKMKGKSVDPDRETRNGTMRQSNSAGSAVSESRRFNQQGQRMRQQHSNSPKFNDARSSKAKPKDERYNGTDADVQPDTSKEGKKSGKKKRKKDKD